MTVKELFDFITDLAITENNLDEYLERAMIISSERSHHDVTEQEKIDEEVLIWNACFVLLDLIYATHMAMKFN